MPDSLRFLLIAGVLAGVVYGGMWALASFAPEPAPVIKPLSSDLLRK